MAVRLYRSTANWWNEVRAKMKMTHDDFASYLLTLNEQAAPSPTPTSDNTSIEYLPDNVVREPPPHHEDFGATPFTPIKPRLIRNQSTLQTFNDLSTTLNNTTVAYSETDVVFMHYPEAELSFSESHTTTRRWTMMQMQHTLTPHAGEQQ